MFILNLIFPVMCILLFFVSFYSEDSGVKTSTLIPDWMPFYPVGICCMLMN